VKSHKLKNTTTRKTAPKYEWSLKTSGVASKKTCRFYNKRGVIYKQTFLI
jgi:hypothetical protein